MPFYQPGLHDRLQFVLHFAAYGDVIKDDGRVASGLTAAEAADATYKTNISLQFLKANHKGLAGDMVSRYNRLALPFERVLRSKVIAMKNEDTNYNITIDTPEKALKVFFCCSQILQNVNLTVA